MKSLLTFGLALAVTFVSAHPAAAFRPHDRPIPQPPAAQPPAMAGLAALDASTCAALEKVFSSPEAIKNFKAAHKAGAQLTKITPLPRKNNDEQRISFSFDKVGNPFGPPSTGIPYHASFTVQFFLPQDAGWQIGEVSPLGEVQ